MNYNSCIKKNPKLYPKYMKIINLETLVMTLVENLYVEILYLLVTGRLSMKYEKRNV